MKQLLRRMFVPILALCLCFLSVIPVDASNQLTLYTHWTTQVTFNANGGVLSGGATPAESAIVGRSSGSVPYSVGQRASTGLSATWSGHIFLGWNTSPNGTGTDLEDYGPVNGPVTFYALFYRTDYNYTGSYQTFHVPRTGYYSITAYGAQGGRYGLQSDTYNCSWGGVALTAEAGRGAMVTGTVHLNAGDTLYVYVGGKGSDRSSGYYNGGFNGGGGTRNAGAGGGATDVRTTIGDMNSRIIVAGGGGGASKWGNGGDGGTSSAGAAMYMEHSGSNVPTGITYKAAANQSSGASFGNGGSTNERGGGGGGGWYGGHEGRGDGAGGGGSSYLAGYSLCNGPQTGASGYTFAGCSWQGGVRTGNGYVRIILTQEG